MKQRISPAVAIVIIVIALALCGAAYFGLSNGQPATPPGSARTIDSSSSANEMSGMRKKNSPPPVAAKKPGDKAAVGEDKKGD